MIPFYSIVKYPNGTYVIYQHYNNWIVPYIVFNSIEDMEIVRNQYKQLCELLDYALDDGVPAVFKEAFNE